MQFDYLREFVVFAHHLKITYASSELHMSQSTLSKHIKLLEDEVKCPLVRYHNGKTYLTKAGAHFLNSAQKILAEFDQLAKECSSLDASTALPEIIVQAPSLNDKAAESYGRHIECLRKKHPNLQVRYTKASPKAIFEGMKQGRIDALVDYRFGDIGMIKEAYRAKGFSGTYLCSDELVILCHKEHGLHRLGELTPDDLRDVPIMTPSDVRSPMYAATVAFCKHYGFDPLFTAVAASSQQEFLDSYLDNSVYFYPASFMESQTIKSRDSMASLRFSDSDIQVHAFLVTTEKKKYVKDEEYLESLTDRVAEDEVGVDSL